MAMMSVMECFPTQRLSARDLEYFEEPLVDPDAFLSCDEQLFVVPRDVEVFGEEVGSRCP